MANRNSNKKYHFIYKTTNLLSGRYYIGMHSTNNLNDGYLGSGKRLRYSIQKYGGKNHKREILEFVESREALEAREAEIVTLDEIAKKECMNLKVGGRGGNLGPNGEHLGGDNWFAANTYWSTKEGKFKKSLLGKKLGKIHSDRFNRDENYKKNILDRLSFKGKKHSEESKYKMSESKKGIGKGRSNSQYGTRWATNGTKNKKIKKTDEIPQGWKLGRVV